MSRSPNQLVTRSVSRGYLSPFTHFATGTLTGLHHLPPDAEFASAATQPAAPLARPAPSRHDDVPPVPVSYAARRRQLAIAANASTCFGQAPPEVPRTTLRLPAGVIGRSRRKKNQ